MAPYESGGGYYHRYGLGAADGVSKGVKLHFPASGYSFGGGMNRTLNGWELKRLPTIMGELGHATVTVLKIDIEGMEWDVIDDILAAQWDYFCIELHLPPLQYFFKPEGPRPNDGFVVYEKNKPGKVANPPLIKETVMLQKLKRVADMWKWDYNQGNKACVEAYFKRKPSSHETLR